MQTLHNDPRIFNSSKDNTDTSGSIATFSLESDPIRVPSQATNITIGVVSATFWYNFPNIIDKSWVVRLFANEAFESGPFPFET